MADRTEHLRPSSNTFSNSSSSIGAQIGIANYFGPAYQNDNKQHKTPLQACLDALFLTNPEQDLEATRRRLGRKVTGTCQWILENTEFEAWKSGKFPQILWISGTPGIGKTVLASFVVKFLQGNAHEYPEVLTYFFCDGKHAYRRTANSILRSLIWQLLRMEPSLLVHIIGEIDHPLVESQALEESSRRQFDDLDRLRTVLRRFMVELKSRGTGIVVIIDALDECDSSSQRETLQFFEDVTDAEGHQEIRLLVTAREEEAMKENVHWMTLLRLVPGGKTNSDLATYITEKVNTLALSKSYPDDLKMKAAKRLTDNAKGTFLWVSFIINDLSTIARSLNEEVYEKLFHLPATLEDIYGAILRKLNDKGAALILSIVTVAERPLKCSELAIMLLLIDPKASIYSDYKVELRETRWECCGSMLWLDDKDNTVNLVHQSARDYLVLRHSEFPRYYVDEAEMHLAMATLCRKYLGNTDYVMAWGGFLWRPARSFFDHPILAEKNSIIATFFDYAAQYYDAHFRKSLDSEWATTADPNKYVLDILIRMQDAGQSEYDTTVGLVYDGKEVLLHADTADHRSEDVEDDTTESSWQSRHSGLSSNCEAQYGGSAIVHK